MTIMPATYGWTSAYVDFWMERFYRNAFTDLYGGRIEGESDLKRRLTVLPFLPEIMLIGNFPSERMDFLKVCREVGLNTVHGEDGFFPHYETMHADPLGFCWESSLSTMVFRECSDRQRGLADSTRSKALALPIPSLPENIRRPFVLWPLQLIGDRVNVCDLNVKRWSDLILDFRVRLPARYHLVLKEHPRSSPSDVLGVPEVVREFPNIHFAPRVVSLVSLLRESCAVAGANSTVLYEARLLHHKPTYAYARSWFSNHEELFTPLRLDEKGDLPGSDWIEDNRLMRNERLDAYTDWFLAQLLARQIRRGAETSPTALRRKIHRLSYHSYAQYGDEIFD